MLEWISSILGKIFGRKPRDGSQLLVDRLDIPAESKLFVAALRVPDDPSCVVYLITSQVLSERSVRDIQCLVAAVRPRTVVAAVQSHLLLEFLQEEAIARDLDAGVAAVPSSFLDAFASSSIDRYSADTLAACEFQRIVFGTTYHGYVLAAKQAAAASGADFQLLEVFLADQSTIHRDDLSLGLDLWGGGLVPLLRQFQLDFQRSFRTRCPDFAASFFPVFLMLDQLNEGIWPRTHGSNAVAAAERIIADTAAGKEVTPEMLEAVRYFRVTLEYFRVLQNDVAARIAMNSPPPFSTVDYFTLPDRDRCEVLLTQALQRQAKKSKVVVAALDGSQVLGVRRYWNIAAPPEVADLSDSFVFSDRTSDSSSDESGGALVAIGAGAAAAAAIKFVPGKQFAPVVAKLAAFSPARSPLVRSMVGLAKRRSLGVVEWSFYGLMRHRSGMPSPNRPWISLGGSVLAAAGLFYAGEQIGGAVEAVPAALSVARLGRGLGNLKRTAAELDRREVEDIYGPAYRVPWIV